MPVYPHTLNFLFLSVTVPAPMLDVIAVPDTPVSGDLFQATCIATFEFDISLDAVRMAWQTENIQDPENMLSSRLTIGEIQRSGNRTFTLEAQLDPVLTLDNGYYQCVAFASKGFLDTDNGILEVYLNATGEKILKATLHIIIIIIAFGELSNKGEGDHQ